MGQVLLLLAVALTVGAVVFGITVLVTGDDKGLRAAEPDGRSVPLPASRPLVEQDVHQVRFDTAVRGYRMAQVDAALRRAAYDIGYKDELIGVLQAEVDALRSGRLPDAEVLRRAREAALAPVVEAASAPGDPAGRTGGPGGVPADEPVDADVAGPVAEPARGDDASPQAELDGTPAAADPDADRTGAADGAALGDSDAAAAGGDAAAADDAVADAAAGGDAATADDAPATADDAVTGDAPVVAPARVSGDDAMSTGKGRR